MAFLIAFVFVAAVGGIVADETCSVASPMSSMPTVGTKGSSLLQVTQNVGTATPEERSLVHGEEVLLEGLDSVRKHESELRKAHEIDVLTKDKWVTVPGCKHKGSNCKCILTMNPSSKNNKRATLLIFYSNTRKTAYGELSKKGKDWIVGSCSMKAEQVVNYLRRPSIAKENKIDPSRIALMGYSMGGIHAGAFTKKAGRNGGVKGMIYLNSGNRNFRGAVQPYADYLIITGMKQKDSWVNGNANLYDAIKAAGGWVNQVKIDADHVGWRKEKKKVFDAITTFLINRVSWDPPDRK